MKISLCTPSIRPAGLEIMRTGLLNQTLKDFEWLVEFNTTGVYDINKAYNRMLRRAEGELFVSLQDYSYIRPDYLQKWWDRYQENSTIFMTAPVGKVDNLNYSGEVKWDWRAYRNNENDFIRPCEWNCWEIDNGAVQMAILKQIGGFDEALDGHWAGDNVNIGCRAQLAGYDFKCVFDNPVLAYDHDAFIPNPFRREIDSTNTKRMAMFRGGMTLPALH